MPASHKKIVVLDSHRKAYKQTQAKIDDGASSNPGLSNRMNLLIDFADIDAPPIDNGRITYMAALTGSSKPAVTDWLSKDKPPKAANFKRLVAYLISYVPGGPYTPTRVEAWLRYGDEVIPCPFNAPFSSMTQELIPLATSLIAEITKTQGIEACEYNLEKVLNDTVQMLLGFNLTHIDEIDDTHRHIIHTYIDLARKKESSPKK